MGQEFQDREVIGRLRELRERYAGPRGKAQFARALGLTPSTYSYYERDRVPPVDVLWRVCQLTGADLGWLVAGESDCAQVGGSGARGAGGGVSKAEVPGVEALGARVSGGRGLGVGYVVSGGGGDSYADGGGIPGELAGRISRLMVDGPKRAALEAFVGLLEGADEAGARRETRGGVESVTGPVGSGKAGRVEKSGKRGKEGKSPARGREREWVPVLGRTAAGLVHFWEPGRLPEVTELRELIERHCGGAGAVSSAAEATAVAPAKGGAGEAVAGLVQLSEPSAEGLCEFVDAPGIVARWPDAFGLRIDGDSMSPRLDDGDIVVVSPSRPAGNGEAAVVKLAGQIGATCKIITRRGGKAHLVAANERYETVVCELGEVEWALAVLWRVRV